MPLHRLIVITLNSESGILVKILISRIIEEIAAAGDSLVLVNGER